VLEDIKRESAARQDLLCVIVICKSDATLEANADHLFVRLR
jgi:hypothetical protein